MTHTICSENLNWVKSERRFHADASTLCFLPGMPMPRRIEVVSQRTGESAFFNLTARVTRVRRRTGESAFFNLTARLARSRFFSGCPHAGWAYTPDPNCRHSAATLGVYIWNT